MYVDKIEILVSVFLVTSPWGEKKKKKPPPKFPNTLHTVRTVVNSGIKFSVLIQTDFSLKFSTVYTGNGKLNFGRNKMKFTID